MKNPNNVVKIITPTLVEMNCADGTTYTTSSTKSETTLIEFIKSLNIGNDNMTTLSRLIDDYGNDCYSNGYDEAENIENY